MILKGRGQRLARWFFVANTVVGVAFVFVCVFQFFQGGHFMLAALFSVMGIVFLGVQYLQFRNPIWPSRLW